MAGLVDQLQENALDQNVPLSTLLRKVKVAASKLKLDDALGWVELELNGYDERPPEYRIVTGELKWWNPMRGWMPVGFGDSKTANHFQSWPVQESVGSLEATLTSNEQTYHLPMPAEVTQVLSQSVGVRVTNAICEVSSGALVGILDRVRGLVLDWALELENAGITGEGLGFSLREQEAARSNSVTIGTFHGNFNSGDLAGHARLYQRNADASTNVVANSSIFGDVEAAIRDGVSDSAEQAALIKELHNIRDETDLEIKSLAYEINCECSQSHDSPRSVLACSYSFDFLANATR